MLSMHCTVYILYLFGSLQSQMQYCLNLKCNVTEYSLLPEVIALVFFSIEQYTCFRDTAQHFYPMSLLVLVENVLTYLCISWVEL